MRRIERIGSELYPKREYETPPKKEPAAMPKNKKVELSARAMSRNRGSSSTMRRCCEGRIIATIVGQMVSAASMAMIEMGRISRAAKTAVEDGTDLDRSGFNNGAHRIFVLLQCPCPYTFSRS